MIKVLNNPSIVVVTDRNDLDNQLYTTFAKCSDYLKQEPSQVESRQDLNEKMEWLMNAMNNNLDAINKEIATSLFIAILEIIMVISIGILNNKKVKNNIEN